MSGIPPNKFDKLDKITNDKDRLEFLNSQTREDLIGGIAYELKRIDEQLKLKKQLDEEIKKFKNGQK